MPPARAHIVATIALAALAWHGRAGSQPASPPTSKPPPSSAPDKEACASAHEQAQIFRKRGRLLEAKQKLELCSSAACPLLARQDCSVWVVEVAERVPTILIDARDTRGQPTTAVKCTLDGERLVDRLDASAIAVNPGAHALKCELTDVAGGAASPVEKPLAVVEGEKGRKVEVSFEPPRAPDVAPSASSLTLPLPLPSASPPASPPRSAPVALAPEPPPKRAPAPALAYTLAGVAAVGVAGFAYFGLKGLSDENQLRDTCKPTCNPADADAVRAKYHIADASLGVGIVAAGFAAWLFFRDAHDAHDAHDARAGASAAPTTGLRLGVQALPGGGGAKLGVTF